jgi:tetratricopeptide (TPR) repeat protein
VASDPDGFTLKDLHVGGVDTIDATEEPLRSYFHLLNAQICVRTGNYSGAKELTVKAVEVLRAFTTQDAIYLNRLSQASTNAASLSALDGEFDRARAYASVLKELGADEMLGPIREQLLKKPHFPSATTELVDSAERHLQASQFTEALEWLLEGESRLTGSSDCATLIDLRMRAAEAFLRLGNMNGAVRAYRRALELSQQTGDQLRMSAACIDLGKAVIDHGDVEAGMPYVRAGICAAADSCEAPEREVVLQVIDTLVACAPQTSDEVKEILAGAGRQLGALSSEAESPVASNVAQQDPQPASKAE